MGILNEAIQLKRRLRNQDENLLIWFLNMKDKLTVNYRHPTNEEITISYNKLTATVTYEKYAEILKNVYRIEDPVKYSEARSKALIEYLENNNQTNTYKW